MRIVITENSNKDLIDMFNASFERVRTHRDFNNPDVVTR